MLATLGIYVASESTFYRIARDLKLLHSRGRARAPSHRRPREFRATGPNQVWAWDITFLPSQVRGRFFKLYVVLDVWSRMIVGAVVHEVEDSSLAAALIESCCLEQRVPAGQLVLHSDNGGAMKGYTMLAKFEPFVVQELDDVSDQDRLVPDRFGTGRAEHFAIGTRPQRLDEEQQVSGLESRDVFFGRRRSGPVQREEGGVWRTDSGEVRWRRRAELVPDDVVRGFS